MQYFGCFTIPNYNVTGGLVDPPSVTISARFKYYSIITCCKCTSFNQSHTTRIEIYSIVINHQTVKCNIPYNYIAAINRMKHPKWRVFKRNSFKQYSIAINKLDH